MFKSATRTKKLIALIGLGLGLTLLIACVSQSPAPNTNAEASNNQPSVSTGVSNGQPVVVTSPPVRSGYSVGQYAGNSEGYINGIVVSGQGLVSGIPDLATLRLGVEASRNTVEAARNDAATSMSQVIDALKSNGVSEQDIQTQYFSINPRYDRDRLNVIGYQVTNQLTVKVRDLERVGQIIDATTQAGGDLTRFQSISFSIEDTKALEALAREAAVKDMMDKANQLATLTGVSLGKAVSISETGGYSPLRTVYAEAAAFDQGLGAPTPIQAGEVDVTINLQAVFAIQ